MKHIKNLTDRECKKYYKNVLGYVNNDTYE